MTRRRRSTRSRRPRGSARTTPSIQNSYAGYLCRNGKTAAGEKLFLEVARSPLYQTPEVALLNAGVCVGGAGDVLDAERYFNRALTIKPNMPEALLAARQPRLEPRRFQGGARLRAALSGRQSAEPRSADARRTGRPQARRQQRSAAPLRSASMRIPGFAAGADAAQPASIDERGPASARAATEGRTRAARDEHAKNRQRHASRRVGHRRARGRRLSAHRTLGVRARDISGSTRACSAYPRRRRPTRCPPAAGGGRCLSAAHREARRAPGAVMRRGRASEPWPRSRYWRAASSGGARRTRGAQRPRLRRRLRRRSWRRGCLGRRGCGGRARRDSAGAAGASRYEPRARRPLRATGHDAGCAAPPRDAAQRRLAGALPAAALAQRRGLTPGVGKARLRLSFSADSWVDIRDYSGKRVFQGNGRANSVKTVAGMAPFRVYLRFGERRAAAAERPRGGDRPAIHLGRRGALRGGRRRRAAA